MKRQAVVFVLFIGLAIAAPHHSKEESSSSESHEKNEHHHHGNGTEVHGHENGTEHHGEHGPEHNGTDLEHNETMHGEAPRAKRDFQTDLKTSFNNGVADVQNWAQTAQNNAGNWLSEEKQKLQQGAQQANNWLQTQGQKIEDGFNNIKQNLSTTFSNMNNNGLQPVPSYNGQTPATNNQFGQPQIQTFPMINGNPSGSNSFGMSSATGGQMVFPNQATGSQSNQLGLQPNVNNGLNPAAEFFKNNIAVSASPTAPQWVIQTPKPWWKFWGN